MDSFEEVIEFLEKNRDKIEGSNAAEKAYKLIYREIHPELKTSGKGKEARKMYDAITDNRTRDYSFIDHTVYDGDKLVFEPYDLFLEDLSALVNVCEENNYLCRVSGMSLQYPGWTIRITIGKNDV